MRILVVEDETITADFMSEILNDNGHTVIGVATDEASALWHGTKGLDLALVDLRLDDGLTGAKAARGLLDLYGIRSIFVSADPTECRQQAKESRAIGCLFKPFSEQELLSTVAIGEALLSGRIPYNPPARLELYSHVV